MDNIIEAGSKKHLKGPCRPHIYNNRPNFLKLLITIAIDRGKIFQKSFPPITVLPDPNPLQVQFYQVVLLFIAHNFILRILSSVAILIEMIQAMISIELRGGWAMDNPIDKIATNWKIKTIG